MVDTTISSFRDQRRTVSDPRLRDIGLNLAAGKIGSEEASKLKPLERNIFDNRSTLQGQFLS